MKMNKVVLVGRLTRDPELRYTPNGVAVANFTVAVNRPFKNQQGEQEADFINCVAWRKAAENLAQYQQKGSLIAVAGSLESSTYVDKDTGKNRYSLEVRAEEIKFLSQPKQQNAGQMMPGQMTQGTNQQAYVQAMPQQQMPAQPQQAPQMQQTQQMPQMPPQQAQQYQQSATSQQPTPQQVQNMFQPVNDATPIEISDEDLPF